MSEQSPKHGQIFISYRREDSIGIAGRIYDRLVLEFSREAIFKDIDSIPLGVNFKQHFDSIIKQCDVVLVIIGNRWLGAGSEAGRSRMDDPRDFVRLEVEAALQRDIPVIPVFVDNALMPAEEVLPASLKELVYRNGIAVGHDPHFHLDVDRLIKNLKRLLASQKTSPPKLPQKPELPVGIKLDIPPREKLDQKPEVAPVKPSINPQVKAPSPPSSKDKWPDDLEEKTVSSTPRKRSAPVAGKTLTSQSRPYEIAYDGDEYADGPQKRSAPFLGPQALMGLSGALMGYALPSLWSGTYTTNFRLSSSLVCALVGIFLARAFWRTG